MFRKLLILVGILLICSPIYADTYVDGYYRKDGTYVQPHYRSSPNSTEYDNYSTKGNYNPYTGKEGTKNPDNDGYSGSYNPYGSSSKKNNNENNGGW
ncbi:MAG: hypothetical protein WC676_05970 [Candidatus Omnitrophota bacterium]